MSSRSYCFTSYKKINPNNLIVRYCVSGKEICPTTNKIHYQGYAEFHNKITYSQCQNALGCDKTLHVEPRKGTRDEARAYCMKDNSYTEIGNWSQGGRGARTDLSKLRDEVLGGKTDMEFLMDDPNVINRYYKFIQNIRNIKTLHTSEVFLKNFAKNFIPNDAQKKIIERLESQGDKVTWVVDKIGGIGKTWLSKYMISQGGLRITNAKNSDIAYSYNGQNKIVIDFSRSLEGRINYDAIEALKNGMVFSSKYQSCSKCFEPPLVLVLANFEPDLRKLSEYKWDCLDLTGNTNRQVC